LLDDIVACQIFLVKFFANPFTIPTPRYTGRKRTEKLYDGYLAKETPFPTLFYHKF
jgi:hypothetical protein